MSNFFVGILVQTMTPKGHFEINWPLAVTIRSTRKVIYNKFHSEFELQIAHVNPYRLKGKCHSHFSDGVRNGAKYFHWVFLFFSIFDKRPNLFLDLNVEHQIQILKVI